MVDEEFFFGSVCIRTYLPREGTETLQPLGLLNQMKHEGIRTYLPREGTESQFLLIHLPTPQLSRTPTSPR